MRDSSQRREFRRLVSEWRAEATPESVGYRLVRTFRAKALNAMWCSFTTGLVGEKFESRTPGQFEAAGFRILSERPSAVAPPGGGDWRRFLLARLDATIDEALEACGSLDKCRYGDLRPVRIRHPISRALSLPLLPSLLDMPTRQLPGDNHMPRVQAGVFGASERFAVSPGRERDGYLMLPGGPSGHPLSPFYRSGFDDWVEGEPTPFLPGSPLHVLELQPGAAP